MLSRSDQEPQQDGGDLAPSLEGAELSKGLAFSQVEEAVRHTMETVHSRLAQGELPKTEFAALIHSCLAKFQITAHTPDENGSHPLGLSTEQVHAVVDEVSSSFHYTTHAGFRNSYLTVEGIELSEEAKQDCAEFLDVLNQYREAVRTRLADDLSFETYEDFAQDVIGQVYMHIVVGPMNDHVRTCPDLNENIATRLWSEFQHLRASEQGLTEDSQVLRLRKMIRSVRKEFN